MRTMQSQKTLANLYDGPSDLANGSFMQPKVQQEVPKSDSFYASVSNAPGLQSQPYHTNVQQYMQPQQQYMQPQQQYIQSQPNLQYSQTYGNVFMTSQPLQQDQSQQVGHTQRSASYYGTQPTNPFYGASAPPQQ